MKTSSRNKRPHSPSFFSNNNDNNQDPHSSPKRNKTDHFDISKEKERVDAAISAIAAFYSTVQFPRENVEDFQLESLTQHQRELLGAAKTKINTALLKLGNKIDAICDHYGVEYSDETNDFVNYESSRFQRKINQVYEQFSKILGSINQLNRLLKDEKKCRIKFEQYTLPPTATEFVFNFDNQTLINCIFGISIKQSSFVNTTFDKIIFSKTSSCYAKTLIGLNNKDQIQFYGHAEYSIDQAEIGSDIDWDNVAREIDQVIRITPDAVAKLVQINLILQTIENNRERSERAKERIEILENEIDDQLDAPLPNDENHDILEDAETSADLAKKIAALKDYTAKCIARMETNKDKILMAWLSSEMEVIHDLYERLDNWIFIHNDSYQQYINSQPCISTDGAKFIFYYVDVNATDASAKSETPPSVTVIYEAPKLEQDKVIHNRSESESESNFESEDQDSDEDQQSSMSSPSS